MFTLVSRLAFILVAVACLRAQTPDPAALFARAMQLQQAGDAQAAVRAYRDFLAVRPDEVGALSNLGVVLSQLGRYDEALAEYEKAGKLAPNDPRIILNIALAYSKSGRLAEARERYEWLHTASPDNQQVTLLLSDTCLQMGESERVISLLKPLENSDDLAVAYMLGTALLRSKRIGEGQVFLDRILSHGDSPEARFLLGTRMFESGDYPAAVKQFSGAAELNADLPDLQSYYGQSLLFTGDADAALQAFGNALRLSRNDYRANLGMGEILVQRQQYTDALPLLRQAALLRPQLPEAFAQQGHALLALGNFADARTALETAEKLGGNSSDLHSDMNLLYTRLKLPREAAREQQALVQAKPASENDGGPAVHAEAPDFELPSAQSSGQTVRLHDFKGKQGVVLVFGSYSCPNFRGAASDLEKLHARYGSKIAFLLVYIREAHTQQNWESTRNVRERISLADATSLPQKGEHAMMCSRKLHLNFPALVDGMDGRVETAYAAWPSKAVVIDLDGRVLYSTRLTELDFHPAELESQLKRLQ